MHTARRLPDSRSTAVRTVNSGTRAAVAQRKAPCAAAARYTHVQTFDHALWAAHRSSNRYFRHTRGLLDSGTVGAIRKPLSYVAAIATAVCAYGSALAAGLLPDDWGFAWPHLMGTSQAFSTSTVALSLLLVFRTQSSYAR